MLMVLTGIALQFGRSVYGSLPWIAASAVLFTALGFVATACNQAPAWWRKPDLATDICYALVLPGLMAYARLFWLIAGMVIGYGMTDPQAMSRFFVEGHGPFHTLSFWWQVPIYLLLSDLAMYVTHRMFHTASLWHYHAVHHSSEHLEWISAQRFHPFDEFFHAVLGDVVLLLLGISPDVLVMLAPFTVGTSALVHANLNWTFGPFRYVFASPVFHRWHHTSRNRGGSSNFAATFPFLDVIFGTFYMPPNELPDRYGVSQKLPEDFVGQMIYPLRPGVRPRQRPKPTAVPMPTVKPPDGIAAE